MYSPCTSVIHIAGGLLLQTSLNPSPGGVLQADVKHRELHVRLGTNATILCTAGMYMYSVRVHVHVHVHVIIRYVLHVQCFLSFLSPSFLNSALFRKEGERKERKHCTCNTYLIIDCSCMCVVNPFVPAGSLTNTSRPFIKCLLLRCQFEVTHPLLQRLHVQYM